MANAASPVLWNFNLSGGGSPNGWQTVTNNMIGQTYTFGAGPNKVGFSGSGNYSGWSGTLPAFSTGTFQGIAGTALNEMESTLGLPLDSITSTVYTNSSMNGGYTNNTLTASGLVTGASYTCYYISGAQNTTNNYGGGINVAASYGTGNNGSVQYANSSSTSYSNGTIGTAINATKGAGRQNMLVRYTNLKADASGNIVFTLTGDRSAAAAFAWLQLTDATNLANGANAAWHATSLNGAGTIGGATSNIDLGSTGTSTVTITDAGVTGTDGYTGDRMRVQSGTINLATTVSGGVNLKFSNLEINGGSHLVLQSGITMVVADLVMGDASQLNVQDGTNLSISNTLAATAYGANFDTQTLTFDLSNYFTTDGAGSIEMLAGSTYRILFDESFYSTLATLSPENGQSVTINFGDALTRDALSFLDYSALSLEGWAVTDDWTANGTLTLQMIPEPATATLGLLGLSALLLRRKRKTA